jgi:hypothetical protein
MIMQIFIVVTAPRRLGFGVVPISLTALSVGRDSLNLFLELGSKREHV